MDLIRFVISRPVTVAVGAILLVLGGLIGFGAIPIQLTPTIDRPIVTIETVWPGRSPEEIVEDITKEQEKQLKNVTNLRSMRSSTSEGQTTVTLEFYVGTNIDRARQEVSDSLRQVPDYPEEVDEPYVQAADGAAENAIAWIIIDLDPEARARYPGFDLATLQDAIDREVRPLIERIDGVASVNVYGGRETEVKVLLDPEKLAARSLGHAEVIAALRAENQNISAGSIAEGKRDYRVRVLGRFSTREELLATVVAYRNGRAVRLADVAEDVRIEPQKERGFVRALGEPALAMNIIRQSGSNVMAIMRDVRSRLDEIRVEVLPRLDPEVGPSLRMRQVYDETIYIESAISLVTSNLWFGAILSGIALLLFLRSFVSTGLIAMAIPVSVIGTFLVMVASGRTLNVISLAGLAFAVGMVVDNAIVVLENIDRRRRLGDPPLTAAYRGAKEVWGAILASTLTTVAVFIPILTIEEEAGQLFRDISLAIAASVLLSLLVSITTIPAFGARLFRESPGTRHSRVWVALHSLFGLAPALDAGVRGFAQAIRWLMTGWRAWSLRPALIVLLCVISVNWSLRLMPPMDYLPAGNRNLVFGGLLIPPGYSVEQRREIATRIERNLEAYVKATPDDPASMARLQPIPSYGGVVFDPVAVDNFFIGSFGTAMFIGATSKDEERVIPVGALVTNAMQSIPDAYGGAAQASLFGRGIGGGNTVNVEIMGPNLARVTDAAGFIFGRAMGLPQYGPGRVRAEPSNFNLSQPEWQLRLTDRGRELGLTTRDVGLTARSLVDGSFVGEFLLDGKAVDILVLPPGTRLDAKEAIRSLLVTTPAGPTVPFDSVVDIIPSMAPESILRLEELPAITLSIRPQVGQTVAELIANIQADLIDPASQIGVIDPTMRVRLEGTAAKLEEVKGSLLGLPRPGSRGLGLAALSVVMGVGLAFAGWILLRGASKRDRWKGAVGAVAASVVVGGLALLLAQQPHLIGAKFVWALVVTYLLMCALFESFIYPFVIMFSIPPAIVGGFAGLRLLHEWSLTDPTKAPQQLDVLTMLGFVILIGTVVNAAILIVEQSLNFMRGEFDAPLPPAEAIVKAVRTRVRPIFMTTFTTLGGMLPLVLAPGAGSEMYRGLGAVVLGGMLVSACVTIVLVPLLFGIVFDFAASVKAAFGRPALVAKGTVAEVQAGAGI